MLHDDSQATDGSVRGVAGLFQLASRFVSLGIIWEDGDD
jgi:hypothetical protein